MSKSLILHNERGGNSVEKIRDDAKKVFLKILGTWIRGVNPDWMTLSYYFLKKFRPVSS